MPFDWWYLPDEQFYHTTITTEKGVSREWTWIRGFQEEVVKGILASWSMRMVLCRCLFWAGEAARTNVAAYTWDVAISSPDPSESEA